MMNKLTYADALNRLRFEVEEEGHCSYIEDEMQVAFDALEKQILKFVECPKGYQGVRDTRYYCPNCGMLTRRYESHCHNCGQAVKYPKTKCIDNKMVLDWSEE